MFVLIHLVVTGNLYIVRRLPIYKMEQVKCKKCGCLFEKGDSLGVFCSRKCFEEISLYECMVK
jgi:hypothetical protein